MIPMALGSRPAPAFAGQDEPLKDSPASARSLQAQEIDDLPDIAAKVNRPLEQIKRMTSDRPETVAMLIKSWLLEETR